MSYGTTLKPKTFYTRIFRAVKKQIHEAASSAIRVEHVGGTSLATIAGKGDIDIYVMYADKREMRSLQSTLTKIFGKPAKVTPLRVRFSFYIEGTEVELQLADGQAIKAAVGLRDYLDAHPLEAKRYATSIAKLRKEFLDQMFKIKDDFTRKAVGKQRSEL